MKRMGVEVTFVNPDCSAEELDAAFRPNTKAMYGETIANPALTVLDIELFAKHIGPNVKMKAAGGISSLEDAEKFLALGADRLGTSRIIKIVKNEKATGY